MGKYHIRTDSYFKEKLAETAKEKNMKNVEHLCDTVISGLPMEIIKKLSGMPLSEAENIINTMYSDFDSTTTSELTKDADLSILLNIVSDYYIQHCLIAWENNKNLKFNKAGTDTKVTITKVFKILLSIGILYLENSEQVLKKFKLPSINTHPPYVCYQHGNKENPNIKPEITKILQQIPANIATVVEPFMGMLGLTLNVLTILSGQELNYYANDADVNLINLYRCIQHNPNKMMLACERLIENLRSEKNTFETIKIKHRSEKKMSKYDYNAAADYMYLDAVSVRHQTENLKKKDGKYISIDKQIEYFYKYAISIPRMHQYLERINVSKKDASTILKKFKKTMNVLYLLDPPYLNSYDYNKKTNEVDIFTAEDYNEIVKHCLNLPDGSIFLLFCRFTHTRSRKRRETDEDIRVKEKNGDFKIDDEILKGFYKKEFGVKAQMVGKQFYYKEIPFDGKGTIEAIISNYQFDGFIPF